METEDFKEQFKAALIAALKAGFTGKEIREQLKEQGYSPPLIEKLLIELQTDRDIIAIVTRQQKIQQIKERTGSLKDKTSSLTVELMEKIDEKITNLKQKIKARKQAKIEKPAPIEKTAEKPRLRKIVYKIPKKKFKLPRLRIPKLRIPKIRIPRFKKHTIKPKIIQKQKIKPKKPSFFKKLKTKSVAKRKLELYNLYYNLLIYEKQRLKEKSKDKNYIKSQKSWIKLLLKYIKKIKPLATPEINTFILKQEKDLNHELKLLKTNKLKTYIKKLNHKRISFKKVINKIKSSKFQKAISKI